MYGGLTLGTDEAASSTSSVSALSAMVQESRGRSWLRPQKTFTAHTDVPLALEARKMYTSHTWVHSDRVHSYHEHHKKVVRLG